ncbi:methyltransferase [Wenjunlia tyrosinilytica]|uniref:Methyltransferase n=2 Tax=Wenjunlia tyrosinilytica TaxID=1544741 RepID=A0A917ZQN1_9ACTN|nr:methyltransferase [Wenjunlia tyrosinilytica]
MTKPSGEAWESYWADLPDAPQEAVWDAVPELATAVDLPLIERYFGNDLPVLDVGCGNGTQTRFLAGRFPRVIGVDFSEAALRLARRASGEQGPHYERLDLCDPAAVAALHERIGDANVHMRVVIHQMPEPMRPDAVAGLRTLVGERGHLFAVELAPEAKPREPSAPGRDSGDLTLPKLGRALRHGLRPASWSEGAFDGLLAEAGFEVLESWRAPLYTTEPGPRGDALRLPADCRVARSPGTAG